MKSNQCDLPANATTSLALGHAPPHRCRAVVRARRVLAAMRREHRGGQGVPRGKPRAAWLDGDFKLAGGGLGGGVAGRVGLPPHGGAAKGHTAEAAPEVAEDEQYRAADLVRAGWGWGGIERDEGPRVICHTGTVPEGG